MLKRIFHEITSRGKPGFFTGMGVTVGCGLILYAIRTPIRADTVNQTADVASEALSDHRLRQQAVVLSNEVVNKLLRNDEVTILVRDVLVRVLQQSETRNALMMLIHNVCDDKYFQETAKKFVIRTLNDPWIIEKINDISSTTAHNLTKNTSLQKEIADILKTSAIKALESERVQESGVSYGRTVFRRVFSIWK